MVYLKEVIRKHEMWLRGEEGGQMADLSSSNLSGSNLSGSNLSGSNLSGSNLSGSNLSGSNLSGVKGLISSIDFMVENFEKKR